mmetsp:Transcript_16603/g.62858  ORF Transcript_16603/g.62858 Transcript_16603/m.62858 type:complete len:267 (-) Transcript_16603:721-1521(-)
MRGRQQRRVGLNHRLGTVPHALGDVRLHRLPRHQRGARVRAGPRHLAQPRHPVGLGTHHGAGAPGDPAAAPGQRDGVGGLVPGRRRAGRLDLLAHLQLDQLEHLPDRGHHASPLGLHAGPADVRGGVPRVQLHPHLLLGRRRRRDGQRHRRDRPRHGPAHRGPVRLPPRGGRHRPGRGRNPARDGPVLRRRLRHLPLVGRPPLRDVVEQKVELLRHGRLLPCPLLRRRVRRADPAGAVLHGELQHRGDCQVPQLHCRVRHCLTDQH